MLEESFIFFEGIETKSEKKIWNQGIKNWKEYLDSETKGFSKRKKSFHRKEIEKINKNLKNFKELSKIIAKQHHWRLWELLDENILFLDIETTGRFDITVIGLFDGEEQKFLVKGKNLSKELFLEIINNYDAIVTFNGRSFDIPVIEKYFGIKIEKIHIDLMHICRKIGLTGGLKNIEKEIGIARPEEVESANGSDAILLWNSYLITGDEEFLMKLLLYNEQDCVNLKTLAEYAIPKLWQKVRFI